MSTLLSPRTTRAAELEHSPALHSHVRSLTAQGPLGDGQRLLAALLTRSFEEYAKPFNWMLVVMSIVYAGGFALICYFVLFFLGHLIAVQGSSHAANLFIGVTSGLMVLPAYALKSSFYESNVSFDFDAKRLDHLHLGRLGNFLSQGRMVIPLAVLCFVLFLHWAALHASPDVLNIEQSGRSISAIQCLMLAVDNALRGLLLGTLEVYQKGVFPYQIELSTVAKPVFLAFRYIETGLAVIVVVGVWQRRRLLKHIRTFPGDMSAEALAQWIESLCRSTDVLHRRYGDEVLFLTIAEEYIRGNTAVVKTLTHQFNQAYVSDEVRDLFRSGEAEPLFERKMQASGPA